MSKAYAAARQSEHAHTFRNPGEYPPACVTMKWSSDSAHDVKRSTVDRSWRQGKVIALPRTGGAISILPSDSMVTGRFQKERSDLFVGAATAILPGIG